MRAFLQCFAGLLLSVLLAGCSHNPNVEIVGSYFPGWMISLSIGVGLTIAVHGLLRRDRVNALGQPAMIYPSLLLLFTCLVWLCLFS
jgi:hypothetical protein